MWGWHFHWHPFQPTPFAHHNIPNRCYGRIRGPLLDIALIHKRWQREQKCERRPIENSLVGFRLVQLFVWQMSCTCSCVTTVHWCVSLNKVFTTMAIRPLGDCTYCIPSAVTHLGRWRKLYDCSRHKFRARKCALWTISSISKHLVAIWKGDFSISGLGS